MRRRMRKLSSQIFLAQTVILAVDPVTGSREYLGSIRKADGTPWQPADAMAAHRIERAALHEALRIAHDGPSVVVTHHPASPRAADQFRTEPGVPWWVPAFYASTALDERLVREQQLEVDGLGIGDRIDAAVDVGDRVVGEAADDVRQGIGRP